MKTLRTLVLAALSAMLAGAGGKPLPARGKPPPRKEVSTATRKAHPLPSPDTNTVYLSEKEIGRVWVHPEGTVLSFPAKPSQVIVGREGQFDVQYVGSDVALVALVPTASASAFVYLLGRRYGLSLKASKERGDRLVFVRDALDTTFPVETLE